ncbi:MAG: ParA family protein [Microbacteriaceae bacterium]|nr:ParA family protein [Microbacteriaceae bacterium]
MTEQPPLAAEIVTNQQRLKKIEATSLEHTGSPRVFAVTNQKGGVGKTTSAVNIAAALASKGMRVLVVDLDPQGNASTALGVEHHGDVEGTYEALIGSKPLSELVQQSTFNEHLWCLPATLNLAGAEIEMVSMPSREYLLKNALNDYFESTSPAVDYVFIDSPPSLGLLTINAFVAASDVLLPIQCEYYALEGLSQLMNNIQRIKQHLNQELDLSTILLTMHDSRTNLSTQVVDEVKKHFPEQTLSAIIPRSVRISEAPSYSQTIISYDPQSSGSIAYLEAALEIAAKGKKD